MVVQAYEERVVCISLPASTDLSSYQFYLGEINTDGQVNVCNSQGERAEGVIYGKPNAEDKVTQFAISGVVFVKAGASIAAGALVTTGSGGLAETATTGDFVFGRALMAASSGEIFSVLISKSGAVA